MHHLRVNVSEEGSSGGVNPHRAACWEGSWRLRLTLIQTGGPGGGRGGAAADVAL